MSKNDSRQERKKRENQKTNSGSTRKEISNVYYWIIGVLFVILIGLVIFIFSRSGDDVNLEDEQEDTEQVEENNGTETPTEEASPEETPEDTAEESDTADNTEDETTEEDTEQTDDTEEEDSNDESVDEGESVAVNEDAPHDPSHAVDYSEGSSDRQEIDEHVIEVTGFTSGFTTRWIGNDGPGRIFTTVSNSDFSDHYLIYLQYGDGNWHVTSYERLSEDPGVGNPFE